jgi:hypothetical protein
MDEYGVRNPLCLCFRPGALFNGGAYADAIDKHITQRLWVYDSCIILALYLPQLMRYFACFHKASMIFGKSP